MSNVYNAGQSPLSVAHKHLTETDPPYRVGVVVAPIAMVVALVAATISFASPSLSPLPPRAIPASAHGPQRSALSPPPPSPGSPSMANFLAMLRNRAGNDPGALKDLRQRADAGDAAAQRNIGLLYVYGWGVTQDYAEAMRWFRKAADQGYAAAQTNVGVLYQHGWGVGQDYVAAMRWFRKAAEHGNVEALDYIRKHGP